MPNLKLMPVFLAFVGAVLFWLVLGTASASAFSGTLGSKEWGSTLTYSITGISVDEASHHHSTDAHHTYSGKITGTTVTVSGSFTHSVSPNMYTQASAGFTIAGNGVQTATWNWPPPGESGELHGGSAGKTVTSSFELTAAVPLSCEYLWISGSLGRNGGVPEVDTLMIVMQGRGQAQLQFIPPPCREALAFYTEEQLAGYYTGKPSLNYSREQLVQQLVDAMNHYGASHDLKYGATTADAVDIARTYINAALPTGKETALQQAAAAQAKAGKLTPGELFETALDICGGNVRDALVTCHAALYRDHVKRNKQFIEDCLAPLRNPEGYADAQLAYTTAAGGTRPLNPRRDIGMLDEQGVWYHFFGMAALELADENNFTPFEAVKAGSQMLLVPEYTEKVRQQGFPVTQIGGVLADYAVALEDSVRHSGSQNKPPDPDKYCINYAGIAAGSALRQHLRKIGAFSKRPVFSPDALHGGYEVRECQGTLRIESPLSLKINGADGSWFSFDQQAKLFDGNTPYVIFEVIPEDDGTWGLVVSPFFAVSRIELTATADAAVSIAVYDSATRTARVYTPQLYRGQVLRLAGFADAPETDGNKLLPVAGSPSGAHPADPAAPAWQAPVAGPGAEVQGVRWQRFDFGEVVVTLPPGWYCQPADNRHFYTFFNAGKTTTLLVMHAGYTRDEYLAEVAAAVEWRREALIGGRAAVVTQYLTEHGRLRSWLVSFNAPLRDEARLHLVFSTLAGNWDAASAEIEAATALTIFK